MVGAEHQGSADRSLIKIYTLVYIQLCGLMKDLATSLFYHSQRFYRSLSFTQEALKSRVVYDSRNNFEIYCEILSRKVYTGVTPKVYMLTYWIETPKGLEYFIFEYAENLLRIIRIMIDLR